MHIYKMFLFLTLSSLHLHAQVSQHDLEKLKKNTQKLKEKVAKERDGSKDKITGEYHARQHISYEDLIKNPAAYVDKKLFIRQLPENPCYYEDRIAIYPTNYGKRKAGRTEYYSRLYVTYTDNKNQIKLITLNYLPYVDTNPTLTNRGVLKKGKLTKSLIEYIESQCGQKMAQEYYILEDDLNKNRYVRREKYPITDKLGELSDFQPIQYVFYILITLGAILYIRKIFK